MTIAIVQVDYGDAQQTADLLMLLDDYTRDPMGGGVPLSEFAREHLIAELAQLQGAVSLIAYDDGEPVGLLNVFVGLSSFAAKRLFNVHDLAVVESYRRRGICQLLLGELERIARARGYCKITLEVLSANEPAQAAYRRAGFAGYELDPEAGQALFWQKTLA